MSESTEARAEEKSQSLEIPEAHFEGQSVPPDWRAEEVDDEDPDDEEIDTPEDVIMMLGFDPAEDQDENSDNELENSEKWITTREHVEPVEENTDRSDKEFREEDHPRGQPENKGQFSETAGNGSFRGRAGDGSSVTADLGAEPDKIPDGWHKRTVEAYGGNPTDGNTKAVDEVMIAYADEQKNLATTSEYDAVKGYSEYKFIHTGMNKLFYDPENVPKGDKDFLQKYASQLESLMDKVRCPADTPVFRGMTATLKDLTGFDDPVEAVGKVFSHKGFVSSSRNPKHAKKFGSTTELHFTIPAGARCALGTYKKEKEIILPPHSLFRISGVTATKTGHKVDVEYLGSKTDNSRQDADFDESEHPRTSDGKFAKTAEGAKAGAEFHAGEEKKYRELSEGHVYRPHARASRRYEEARGLYESGETEEAHQSHGEAESHGLEALKRTAVYEKKQGKQQEPAKAEPAKAEPAKAEPAKAEPQSNAGWILQELDKKSSPDSEYRKALSTSSKDPLKKGETWRDRLVKLVSSLEGPSVTHDQFMEGIKGKAPVERDYHAVAWSHASSTMKQAILKMPPVRTISNPEKLPSYRAGDRVINIPKSYGSAHKNYTPDELGDVFRHEYGHALDYQGTLNPRSMKAFKIIEEEAQNLLSSQNVKEFVTKEKGKNILSSMISALPGDNSGVVHRHCNDFFGAMTSNRIGYGHSNEYYSEGKARRTIEMFANYVSLTQGPDGKKWTPILHKFAPRSCTYFDKIIRGEV